MLNGMDTAQYGPCDTVYHIACLRREGELLADAAERAGLGAVVPACPGWHVRDLLKHLGYVHRWAAGYVREQHPRWVDRATEEQILSGGPRDDALPGWFRAGHAALVRVLEAADPGMTCWTFLEAPSALAFWARRQAHETAIHRADAQQAAAGAGAAAAGAAGAAGAGTAGPEATRGGPEGEEGFAPRFAADGIDELIMGFLGRDAQRGSWDGPHGTLGLHASDGAGAAAHWRVAAGPGQLAVSRETGPADCDVTGAAADLYLLLWNRRDASGLDVRGDAGALAAFCEHIAVTWR
jgi:uncharacterized protein (TIGR03083 family)